MLPRSSLWFALPCAALLAACAGTPYQPAVLNGNVELPSNLIKNGRDVMVRQRLMDVTGSGGAADVLSEQFLNNPKRTPVVYALTYDRRAVHAGGHYEVDSQVYANGSLRMQGTTMLTGTDAGLPATADVTPQPIAP
ncbi:MAG: YbaY family lipoprotein [Paludibacterium sp.]|uniref:YbaY family lipoprotein n=1 Tax=Paludibacterium sp. TaxID=1917523 RepID=UPI0025D5378D|nr:YbaY family lipoprotein [Paludibacterium sp.]MBV8047740.1 YbaY family lipoprotein [Paludibacterium sp.]